MNQSALDQSINEISTMQRQFDLLKAKTRAQPATSWQTRQHHLKQLEKMIEENKADIITAISKDFGHRSAAETTMLEIFTTLSGIRHLLRHGKKWIKPKRVRTGLWFLPAKSYIQSQPLGVVGVIAPWNYPLYLIIEPLAGALVAGNRVMLKVSEAVPHFEAWLAETIPKYFSNDEVYVVKGGLEVAKAFSELAFDHLFFTGSTNVGKQIMQAAAKNLTPVTLELGGKSPVIITPSADIPYAVSHIWMGKSLNAGQTCVAPDYILLPKSSVADFIEQSKAWFNKHYPDIDNNQDYSHIINARQFNRLQNCLNDAKLKGAQITALAQSNIQQNAVNTGNIDEQKRLFVPHIVTDLPENATLLTDEIFGPILPLVPYDKLADAIEYVNQRERPLALYVFGNDSSQTQRVLDNTVSGGACVNETLFHLAQPNLPFGGVGSSGMGNYHGQYSFEVFSHQKSVLKQSRLNAISLLLPPYGKVFWKMMGILTKF